MSPEQIREARALCERLADVAEYLFSAEDHYDEANTCHIAAVLLPLALDAIEERDAEIARLRARLDAGDEPHPLECPACGDDVNRCHCMNELYVRRANERAAWPDPGEQAVS